MATQKYARLDANGMALEICDADALATHEPTLAATFIACPSGTRDGATFLNGYWTAPVDPGAEAPVPPMVSPPTFFMLFTVEEETAIRAAASANPEIATWLRRLDDPRLKDVDLALASVQAGIAAAISIAGSPSSRVAEILTGVLQ